MNFKLNNILGNSVYIEIDKMNDDILAQIILDLISDTAKFSLQFDETTNVSNLSQLAVFVHYENKEDVKKEVFLFCQPLITTKAAEVKKFVDNFFRDNDLSWDIVYAICLDGARVMLERNFGFGTLLKANAPHITVTHCLLHRHALATKTFTPKLAEVLKIVVEYVNYVRNNAMKQHIFKELCNEISSVFELLLYYSNVWGLSRRKMLNRVFTLRVELAVLLREHQHRHADCFENSEFILVLAYMVDIFDALNNLNQKMQGGGVNIIEVEEHLKTFKKK